MNGTFLQTRKFINYHPDGRFSDCSLCIRKGNELVGAILACKENDGNIFFAHKGTTFGGISISKKIYSAAALDEMMQKLISFIQNGGFENVYLKMVPNIYQRENSDMLDYFLYKYGFKDYCELNYYMHLDRYKDDILSQFSSSKRRDYRYSIKNGLEFKKLTAQEEIAAYYSVLLKNLKKLNLHAIHSLNDLYDLKFHRFNEKIEFYGVYYNNKIIAGSMIFIFNDKIFHTQYLSSDEDYLHLFPMDFLITNLIQTAVEKNMDIFSFGICTENQGQYLNLGLSRFKEGFGTEFCINRSFEKSLL